MQKVSYYVCAYSITLVHKKKIVLSLSLSLSLLSLNIMYTILVEIP